MITMGFTFSYSDLVTIGKVFPAWSTFIYVQGAGDIVYQAQDGTYQWIQAAQPGYHQISTNMIVSSGTVNGTTRTTSATGLMYCYSPKY